VVLPHPAAARLDAMMTALIDRWVSTTPHLLV